MNCLSVFDHFVELALRVKQALKINITDIISKKCKLN